MTNEQTLRLGLVGYGDATRPTLPSFTEHGHFELVGAADTDPVVRGRFEERFGLVTYDSIAKLFDSAKPDAVYIATPTRFHEEMTVQALEQGIHVLCEKPMAITVASGLRMLAAADHSGRVFMENHKRSVDRQVITIWQMLHDGAIGDLKFLNRWHSNDWFYRPRAAEERDPVQGGIVLRQGAHEFDIIRLLTGARPVSVRGWTGDYDRSRPGEGAYQAWIEFEDGVVATSFFNGYDHFSTNELTNGPREPSTFGTWIRKARGQTPGMDEAEIKRRVPTFPREGRDSEGVFGFTLASGTSGDLRYSTDGGVWLYGEEGRRRFRVDGTASTDFIVHEFYDAITNGQTPIHDGRWGLSVLELCLAVRASAASGAPVSLQHQHEVPETTFAGVIGSRTLEQL